MRGGQNYLVIETEAQGFPEWTPYPGQLRLQAFSHLASGANMVSYWHWATTHNGIETYWRGLLSQDYAPNATYQEATGIGADFKRLGASLAGLQKSNKVAIYFSNRALSGFNTFKFGWISNVSYNDVLRPFYDALYRMNVETDFIDPSTKDLARYQMIVIPALYAASDNEIARIKNYIRSGGHVVLSFKSGFSDENLKVRSTNQPGGFADAVGATYSQFAIPEKVSLAGDPFGVGPEKEQVKWWMELLQPSTATVVAHYNHPVWGKYAAVTRKAYGKGEVMYVGFMPGDALLEKILGDAAERAGVARLPAELQYPVIVRGGVNPHGRPIHYFLNYSAQAQTVNYPFGAGTELLSGQAMNAGARLNLPPWGVEVIEESN